MDHSIYVRAPGRICVFGEHQDYLGYPVIAAAINRYIYITGAPGDYSSHLPFFHITLPDVLPGRPVRITIPPQDELLSYREERDYLRSGINVAKKRGVRWSECWDVLIRGDIPINAGASSSSALNIAWLSFLFAAAGHPLSQEERAMLGYQAEVAEFCEAGGQMDHFASSCGSMIYIEATPTFKATPLTIPLQGFVLGNSCKKKDTINDLKKIKAWAMNGFAHLREIYPSFDPKTSTIADITSFLPSLAPDEARIVYGSLSTRDLTCQGIALLGNGTMEQNIEFHQKLGGLFTAQHAILSQYIRNSLPCLDEMVTIACQAGAFGGKINGSGFGGTMFAYAPGREQAVVQSLVDHGYEAYPIEIVSGAEWSRRPLWS